MTRVSVCVVTLGRPSLASALESIGSQSFEDYEVLVGHAERHEFARRLTFGMFPERGRTFRCDGDTIPEARNQLLEAANGEHIAVLDDDDRMCPGRLEYQADVLDQEGVALVGQSRGTVRERHPDGTVSDPDPFHADDLESGCVLVHSTVMFEAGYRYRPKFTLCEEFDLFLRILDDVGESGVRVTDRDLDESGVGHGSTSEQHGQMCEAFATVARMFHQQRKQTGTDGYEDWRPPRIDHTTEAGEVPLVAVLGGSCAPA